MELLIHSQLSYKVIVNSDYTTTEANFNHTAKIAETMRTVENVVSISAKILKFTLYDEIKT
jgi:hypothetical protein